VRARELKRKQDETRRNLDNLRRKRRCERRSEDDFEAAIKTAIILSLRRVDTREIPSGTTAGPTSPPQRGQLDSKQRKRTMPSGVREIKIKKRDTVPPAHMFLFRGFYAKGLGPRKERDGRRPSEGGDKGEVERGEETETEAEEAWSESGTGSWLMVGD